MLKSRLCRKCKEKIPFQVIIQGKERNLQNRKFCLNCSPFGSRNTKPDDPARPTRKSSALPYALWTEEAKEENRRWQYKNRQARMGKIIKLKGGECSNCSYSKSYRALSFHHRDPSQKQFELSTRQLTSHAWEDIIKELAKCDLLCLNCHAELEEEKSTSRYV
tara:strand:- start:950 stop:1438 length:489 start_codon:yes stop_codon:yes gene_type:complete